MFQPQKPATIGQVAIALATGDTSDQLGEEVARLEAERMADEAVAADAAMEARTQKEVKALFDEEIETERKLREEAEKLLAEAKTNLEKITTERDAERDSLLKGQADVEAEKDLLYDTQYKVDEQLQALATLRVEISYEKERLQKLSSKIEQDQESASRLRTEIDSEKKSLVLARYSIPIFLCLGAPESASIIDSTFQLTVLYFSHHYYSNEYIIFSCVVLDVEIAATICSTALYERDVELWDRLFSFPVIFYRLEAEEEAQKARELARVLEEARQHWAGRGIEIHVDKSFDDNNIPGPSWRYTGGNTDLEKVLHRAPLQDVIDKGENLKTRINNGVLRYWHLLLQVVSRFYYKILELLGQIRRKSSQLSLDTFSHVNHRMEDTRSVVAGKIRGVQDAVLDASAGAMEGSKRFADGCRSGVGKISQRFKHD